MKLDKDYWELRYEENETGWDIGTISPPLKAYIDQLQNRELKILIPGGGNSYEAEYLFNKGFKNVFVMDIAKTPLINLQKRVPNFPDQQLLQENYFEHAGNYDLLLEQTFFCALPVSKRKDYASKAYKLLKPGGTIAGLLFNMDFKKEGPPYGGSKEEYEFIFRDLFFLQNLETCYNSIPPRQGNELFFIFKKKYPNA